MTANKKEELKAIKELLECGAFTEEEIMNDPKRTIKEKQMLGLLKDSKTNETIETNEETNETEYTIEQLLDEVDNIVDTALKDNPMLQHILNHSYDIAKAYTLINFDNEVKEEYEFDRIDNDEYDGNRMYSNLADCFYTSSMTNEHFTIDIIKALIIAIINNDWCFIADIYFNNMNGTKAMVYLNNAARLSLDSKAYHKTKHSNT